MKSGLVLRSRCTCPGNTLTFECTVSGMMWGATVWRGSALDSNYCRIQEIVLLHDDYSTEDGIHESCGDSIEAQTLRVENGSYTSQFNITVTSDLIGKSIECAYDDNGGNTTSVGFLNITLSGISLISPCTSCHNIIFLTYFS